MGLKPFLYLLFRIYGQQLITLPWIAPVCPCIQKKKVKQDHFSGGVDNVSRVIHAWSLLKNSSGMFHGCTDGGFCGGDTESLGTLPQ